MAGIGFELRRLSNSRTYFGLLRAYAYAGIVSSGPWVLSIAAILMLGILSIGLVVPSTQITEFQVSVTWMIALSLIYTGGFQLIYTRYVADRLFEQRPDRVVPNLTGAMLVLLLPASVAVSVVMAIWFPGTSLAYRLLMIVGFVLLCMVWVLTVLLSGLKQFRSVLIIYMFGYGAVLLIALGLRPWGMEGLLGGFVAGQALLVVGMTGLVWKAYPPTRLIELDFFRHPDRRLWLVPAGILFNAGVWVDKFIFWLSEGTSSQVIGVLRSSVIYDTPTFMAYLTIVPGMAVFLFRMEVDFVRAYDRYFSLVRDGGTLAAIEEQRVGMVIAARHGIRDILGTQGLTLLVLMAFSHVLLPALGISVLFSGQLAIISVGVMLQLLVMAALNILFYLDDLRETVAITAVMLVANAACSWASIALGPYYYGYGFACGMLIASVVALPLVNKRLDRLNYETFMQTR